MKKNLLLLFTLFFAMSVSFAQVYVFEPFDYAVAPSLLTPAVNTNSVTNTAWWNYSAGSPNDMAVTADPGWALDQAFDLNPTGNAVSYKGGGEDGMLPFFSNDPNDATSISGAGTTVYLSFLIQVTGWDTTTGSNSPSVYRQVNLGINSPAGNVGSGLFIGPGTAPLTYQLGYGNSDSTSAGDVVFSPTNYSYVDIGTDPDNSNAKQFFIVIKYTIGVGGGSPDGAMWINPTIGYTVPTPDLTHTATNKVRTEFKNVLLQASSNARTPECFVDEIRVTGTWAQALGLAYTASVNNVLASKLNIYPNPAKDYITVESKSVRISSVAMYNLLGAQVISEKALVNSRLSVSSLAKGIYMLKINTESGSVTKKVVID